MARADVTRASCLQIFLCVDNHYRIVNGERVSQPLTGDELIAEVARFILSDDGPRYMQSPDDLVRRMEFRGQRRREREAG